MKRDSRTELTEAIATLDATTATIETAADIVCRLLRNQPTSKPEIVRRALYLLAQCERAASAAIAGKYSTTHAELLGSIVGRAFIDAETISGIPRRTGSNPTGMNTRDPSDNLPTLDDCGRTLRALRAHYSAVQRFRTLYNAEIADYLKSAAEMGAAWSDWKRADRVAFVRQAVSLLRFANRRDINANEVLPDLNALWGVIPGRIPAGCFTSTARAIQPRALVRHGDAPAQSTGAAIVRRYGKAPFSRARKDKALAYLVASENRIVSILGKQRARALKVLRSQDGALSSVSWLMVQQSRALAVECGDRNPVALLHLAETTYSAAGGYGSIIDADRTTSYPIAAPEPILTSILDPASARCGAAITGWVIWVMLANRQSRRLLVLRIENPGAQPVCVTYHAEPTESVADIINRSAETGRIDQAIRAATDQRRRLMSEAEKRADSRKRVATIIRRCRALPVITYQDSRQSGNCAPGTDDFIGKVLKNKSAGATDGRTLAARWRAYNRQAQPIAWRNGVAFQTDLFLNAINYSATRQGVALATS